MPHIIFEYADSLMESNKVEAALNAIHLSVAQSGLFEESHIKTRAYSFKTFARTLNPLNILASVITAEVKF